MPSLIESGSCELTRFNIRGVQPRMQIAQRLAPIDQVILATLLFEIEDLQQQTRCAFWRRLS
jgi:hypothetical protein